MTIEEDNYLITKKCRAIGKYELSDFIKSVYALEKDGIEVKCNERIWKERNIFKNEIEIIANG